MAAGRWTEQRLERGEVIATGEEKLELKWQLNSRCLVGRGVAFVVFPVPRKMM